MAADIEMPDVSFAGSAKVKDAASRAFQVMRARGMFMSDNAPIHVEKDQLIAFLVESGASENDAESALTENPNVFAIETDDAGTTIVVTTRAGIIPVASVEDHAHGLASRLMTPQPIPEKPAAPPRERVSVDPSWATFTVPYFDEEDEELEGEIPIPSDMETGAPVEETVEAAAEIVEEPQATVEQETPPVREQPVEPVTSAEIVTSKPAATDVTDVDDATVAQALDDDLAADTHVARFGDQWMAEDRVDRLSRGDIRRIKDYIEEQEQPLTDESLAQDILGVRPNNPDYTRILFSLNYRLSKEKEFEFVGTRDQRFWSITTLPAIGTDRRKHNDIGTDFRFLVDGVSEDIDRRSVQAVDHVVTFYEQTLGLLPFNADMQKLMASRVNPDQKTAILTFEIPQTYTTYLVELRYPTPNRGGFLLGLDDFYADSIVPGAALSISATENDGHYKLEYLQNDDQEDRLLELDDRRSARYVFRPTTYNCVVDDAWMINEDRFPNLANEKPLADKIRRRTDEVLKATFERIGMDDGDGGKLAAFDDLLAAVNIERPYSEEALRAAIEADSHVSGDDANGYTYATGS